GTQVGLLVMMAILAAGLSIIVAQAAVVFDIVRLLGAAYLIYLGVRLWRSDGALAEATAEKGARNFFLQGFLVILSNPKALIFFGAFIPQFVDPSAPATPQIVLLAATFMVVATAIDGAYAVAAGSLGRRLTRTRIRLLERVSGTFLIAGGIWLALSRRA
ncbi:MAG: LysE family translocator, partial [Planctomycetota bacterium]